MLEGYITAGALGLLLGLRYRAAALIVMSALVTIVGVAAALFAGWSFVMAVLAAFGAACVLQCGYLLGLLIGHVASRTRALAR